MTSHAEARVDTRVGRYQEKPSKEIHCSGEGVHRQNSFYHLRET